MNKQKLFGFAVKNLQAVFLRRKSETVNRLDVLDGFRALSFLWVLAGHTALVLGAHLRPQSFEGARHGNEMPYRAIFNTGLAVDVFFVLSGFLLGKVCTEQNRPYLSFLGRRFLRIWPALAFVVVVNKLIGFLLPAQPPAGSIAQMLEYTIAFSCAPWQGWLMTLVFANNFFPTFGCGLQDWSIGVEFQMYLVTPFLIYAYGKSKIGGLAIMAVLTLGSLAIRLLFFYRYLPGVIEAGGPNIFVVPASLPDEGAIVTYIYQTTYSRCGSYLVGLVAYFFYQSRCALQHSSNKGGADEDLPLLVNTTQASSSAKEHNPMTETFVGILLLAVSFSLAILGPFTFTTTLGVPVWFAIAWATVGRLVFAVSVALVMLHCLFYRSSYLSRFFASPVLFPIASISFTGYIIQFVVHSLVLPPLASLVPGTIFFGHYMLFVFVVWLTVFPFGLFLSVFIEIPGMKARKILKL